MNPTRRSLHRFFWLAAAVVAALPLAGCSDGGECDTCTVDADCKAPLLCSRFDNGDMRCGSGTGSTQCRVR
jgi:hypothetical protein